MKKMSLRPILSAILLMFAMMACTSMCMADTYNVSVWNGAFGSNTFSETANLASQPTGGPLAVFQYTGSINFNPSINTITAFFAPGTLSNFTVGSAASLNTTLSTPDGSHPEIATYMIFSGNITAGFLASVLHDDGASLYVNGVTCFDSSGETVAKTSSCTTASAGPYKLVYVASNGLPEVLKSNTPGVTPEPASLLLLGTGFLGVAGAVRRKLSL